MKQRKPNNQGLLIVEYAKFTATELDRAVNRALNREALKQEAMSAYFELNYLVQRIDLIAIGFTQDLIAQQLKGTDEELAKLYVRLKGCATKLGHDIDQLYPDAATRIHERIEAIQLLHKDKGESLRKVIAGMPGDMGSLARFILDKIRQGQHISEEVEFLHQQALYYYVELRNSWVRATALLLDDLDVKAERLSRGEIVHDYHSAAHNVLKKSPNPAQYFKNAYHSYRKSKSFRRKQ